jgi:hypothetical protein
MTIDDAVAGIAATITAHGLKCHPVRDDGDYPGGIKISDARMEHLQDRVIERGPFRGEWNYAVLPVPRPAPGPAPPAAPAPGPDLQALAALAGIGDLGALLEAVAVPCAAAREQRLYLDRGDARRITSGPAGPARLPFAAAVAAAACHHRAGISYRLLGHILGTSASTVSLAASRITPVLAQHAITPRYQRARIRTLSQLQEHAAAAGITLTIPENGQAMPDHVRTRTKQATRDTPETGN